MNKTTFQIHLNFLIRSLTELFSSRNVFGKLFLTGLLFVLSSNRIPDWQENTNKTLKNWTWEIIKANTDIFPGNDSHWAKRAGLQALSLNGKFYIFGGRTPISIPGVPIPGLSIIHGDVWSSADKGKSWKKILESNPTIPGTLPDPNKTAHWANRSYFQAIEKGSYMYIIGGQDYNIVPNPSYPDCGPFVPPQFCTAQIPVSQFFNDVWRSKDGVNWTKMIENQYIDPNDPNPKHWAGRAGLSAAVFKGYIYVMGGSVNDDSSIVGGGAPARQYFNDVWRSHDGQKWEKVGNAPWAPRAGGVAVVKEGYLYMVGGEEGFICVQDLPPGVPAPPCPPYFNDVWRTKDGVNWEEMTSEAEWTKRPGHQVVVAQNQLVLFGGFGLGDDNGTTPSNPSDVWVSKDGSKWEKVSDAPWNATGSEDIKYDFDAVVEPGYGKFTDAIYTFGGDRETFDFSDQENYKNVDNDVWKFSLPKTKETEEIKKVLTLYQNYPNPFTESTTIKYLIPENSFVSIKVYDRHGGFVSTLVAKTQNKGEYEINWNGKNHQGKPVKEGIYYISLWSNGNVKTIKLYKN